MDTKIVYQGVNSLQKIINKTIFVLLREMSKLEDNNWLTRKVSERIKDLKSGIIQPSIVIPVNQAFPVTQKVLPRRQIQEILSNAEIIAQTECECRLRVKECNAPTDVCIVLNTVANKYIKENRGQKITIEKANEILDKTAEYGLVHLSLCLEGHQPDAICSCCPCCCHDLRAMLDFGNLDMVLESDYIAEFDEEKCINCGNCIERCYFKAYTKMDGHVVFLSENCYGCGLCIISCPVGAIKLVERTH